MVTVTLHYVDQATRMNSRKPANRGCVGDDIWERLVNRIISDESVERELAERIMDQAIGFLRLCALEPDAGYAPSKLVDIGWHTFLMYTRAYAQFCDELCGRFIHHEPSDKQGVVYGIGEAHKSMLAMEAVGLPVDQMLWANSGDCSTYCSGDSCSGGGGDGDSAITPS